MIFFKYTKDREYIHMQGTIFNFLSRNFNTQKFQKFIPVCKIPDYVRSQNENGSIVAKKENNNNIKWDEGKFSVGDGKNH